MCGHFNNSFKALGMKRRHQEWDIETGSAMHLGAASKLHNQVFDEG